MDLSEWLRQLGLERYENNFQKQEVDLETLPELDEDDLKALGLPLGPRRKLLKALAERTTETSPPSRPGPAPHETESNRQVEENLVERRQITVMFCDLVGSSDLASQLDPEDMRRLIAHYHQVCARVIARWEGYIASYLGDGVMVYFGWPRVHEDDGARAVHAALDITSELGNAACGDTPPLNCRIGIATGLVVVGNAASNGRLDEAAIGETPNLAARLQAFSSPGKVVISSHTRRLLGNLFELVDLGSREIRGFARSIRVWEVAGESNVQSRFEALRGTHSAPLIGRSVEMGLLRDRWELAKSGEGQVVLLTGLPGLGKSRLVRAFLEAIGKESFHCLQYHCSPYHTNSALHPIVESLKQAAGLKGTDPNRVKLQRLEQLARRTHKDITQAVPLLASLISIPCEPHYTSMVLSADAKKGRIFEFLIEQIANLAATQPVVMVLEDAHWLDPTSMELFSQIADRLQTLPVLLLITSRSHELDQIGSHAHLTSHSLNRLSRGQVTTMIREVSGNEALPDEIVEHILARTDGIPLFIEELTKMLLESDILQPSRKGVDVETAARLRAIPATLQDLLTARLDRLPEARELAQIGAVIGREFSYDLLARLAPYSESTLQRATSQLIESELVFSRGTPPEASFRFKHAFIQDAAHESLLKSHRQQLHSRLAEILLESFEEVAAEQPEVIAQHFMEGKRPQDALVYWKQAGQRAAERSSAAEATAHFRQALHLLQDQPWSEDRDREKLELLTLLGSNLISTRGAGANDVAVVYEQAAELYKQFGAGTQAVPVLQGLRLHFQERADLQTASEMADRLMDAACRLPDARDRLEAHRAKGVVHYFAGNFLEAHDLVATGLEEYGPHAEKNQAANYENDACMTCAAYQGRALYQLGYPDQAVEWTKHALAYAERAEHIMSLVEASTWRAEIAFYRGDFTDASEFADSTLRTATKHGLPLWTGLAVVLGGSARFAMGEQATGIADIREGIARLDENNQMLLMLHCRLFLLRALAEIGQVSEGFELSEQIERNLEGTGVGYLDAPLQLLRGELHLAKGKEARAEAERCFRDAMEIARKQNAKTLELRSATRLSELWVQQRRPEEARALLKPLHDGFYEGFDTQDMRRANRCLSRLN